MKQSESESSESEDEEDDNNNKPKPEEEWTTVFLDFIKNCTNGNRGEVVLAIAELLLAAGGDVWMTDYQKQWTVLHCFVQYAHETQTNGKILDMLLEHSKKVAY